VAGEIMEGIGLVAAFAILFRIGTIPSML